jgi:iron-sulfur cluster repair protein YtfE (RIC family)
MLGERDTSGDLMDRERGSSHESVPLDRLLATAAFDPAALDPAQVRAVILTEHQKIRALLARLESDATELLACSVPKSTARHALRQQALNLCDQMGAHIAFENQLLVPVVGVGDAWGPVRAQRILEEHEDQMQLLRAYADLLMGSGSESNPGIAVTVWQLVQSIGADMREEEAHVLSPEFLSDRIGQNVETG